MQTSTKDKIVAALNTIRAIGDTVRDLGEVPSGHLYATVSAMISLDQYQKAIGLLIDAKLIEKRGDVLVWIASTREQVAASKAEYDAEQTAKYSRAESRKYADLTF